MDVDLGDASDATLVVAVARWEEAALGEIYRRHGGAVHALCRRVAGSEAAADEITQEVFVALWDHPESFDAERGSLRSFLLARAHGRSVDVVRAEVARRRREETDGRRAVDVAPDVDGEVWGRQVAADVRGALGRLPEEQRRPIELAYFGGHTYREVAAILDQPEGTVKSRIRAGLERLREGLADRGITPQVAQP